MGRASRPSAAQIRDDAAGIELVSDLPARDKVFDEALINLVHHAGDLIIRTGNQYDMIGLDELRLVIPVPLMNVGIGSCMLRNQRSTRRTGAPP